MTLIAMENEVSIMATVTEESCKYDLNNTQLMIKPLEMTSGECTTMTKTGGGTQLERNMGTYELFTLVLHS